MSFRASRPTTRFRVRRPASYTPEFCDRVVELMAEGRSLEGCALLLGVHPDLLYAWQRRYREFHEAVSVGRIAATTFWENRLLAIAHGAPGNFQAIQWALRNRSSSASGWYHDGQKVQHGNPSQPECDLVAQTLDRREDNRLAQPLSPSRQGLGMPQPQWPRLPTLGFHPPDVQKALPNHNMILVYSKVSSANYRFGWGRFGLTV